MKKILNILVLGLLFSNLYSQNVEVYFGEVDLESNSVDVMYNSEIEIGGAQFDFVGGTLDSYSGGTSGDAGWTVSGSSTTWIGFSFAGITLPTGENVLTQITFSATGDEICLDDVVLSDNAGNTFPVNIGECASLSVNNDVEGCIDPEASNYNPEATVSGECYYSYPDYGPGEQWDIVSSTLEGFIRFDNITINGEAVVGGEMSGQVEICPDQNCDMIGVMFNNISVGWSYCSVVNDGITLLVNFNDSQTPGVENYPSHAGGFAESTVNFHFFDASEQKVYYNIFASSAVPFSLVEVGDIDITADGTSQSGITIQGNWQGYDLGDSVCPLAYANNFIAVGGSGDEELCDMALGCIDQNALNYNSEAFIDNGSCLYDPFDEWTQSTVQSFYVINALEINGEMVSDDDSLYVIGAFCGDTVMTEVGSIQWDGNGTTLVVMGTDGVTEETDNYCFFGLPQFGIPADIPIFKVYNAISDEMLDAQFNICLDSNGDESNCAFADFGYNNIDQLIAFNCETDIDECGVCDGDGILQECGCGTPGEYGIPEGYCDCNGNQLDCVGVCGGVNIISDCGCIGPEAGNEDNGDWCDDCAGTPNGSSEIDECGVCGGFVDDYEDCPKIIIEDLNFDFSNLVGTSNIYYESPY